MTARDVYRPAFDPASAASAAAKSATMPEESGRPLMRKWGVLPQRRPNRQYFIGQATGNRFSGSVEIIVHWKQPIRFELTENASHFLLDSVYGVKEITAIHGKFPAAQLPIGAQEKVIPEYTILQFC